MPETKRAVRPEPPDVASDRMAELLRRADALLAEWSQFGVAVRTQVEREAAQIGHAVVDATDLAVRRAASEGTSRAIAEQLGKQLTALSAEVGKLETRARAASRAIAEQRRGDRTLLYGLAAAMLAVIALLVVLLLRAPTQVIVAEPVPVASPIAPVSASSVGAAPTAPAGEGSAAGDPAPTMIPSPTPNAGISSGSAKPAADPTVVPEMKTDPKATPAKANDPTKSIKDKSVKQGAPSGAKAPAIKPISSRRP
jgi:hypothetical protein